MEKIDIRKVKNDLRDKFKYIRSNMPYNEKSEKDSAIFNNIISINEFKNSNIVLSFVSTPIEVDTINFIKYSLNNNKIVAVPKCLPNTNMAFYIINSFNDLKKGAFSLLEPDIKKCKKLEDFSSSICITPGLAFDMQGFRLGYGKGYYDRFFSRYNNTIIGVCYSSCLKSSLPHGRYDKPIDILITDKFVKRFKK